MTCLSIALAVVTVACMSSALAAVKVLLEPMSPEPEIQWPLPVDPSVTLERRHHDD